MLFSVNSEGALNTTNEKLIDDLEKVPFYGPYLAWLLAVHVGLLDATNLTNLRNALYEETHRATK